MNLHKNKTLFILLFLSVVIGFCSYSYIYKPHQSIENATVNYHGDSKEFLKLVKKNAITWLDQTIVLTGVVCEIDKNGIILDNIIYCQFKKSKNSNVSNQTEITIKGNMIGYDDLLEEVKLNQCIILK